MKFSTLHTSLSRLRLSSVNIVDSEWTMPQAKFSHVPVSTMAVCTFWGCSREILSFLCTWYMRHSFAIAVYMVKWDLHGYLRNVVNSFHLLQQDAGWRQRSATVHALVFGTVHLSRRLHRLHWNRSSMYVTARNIWQVMKTSAGKTRYCSVQHIMLCKAATNYMKPLFDDPSKCLYQKALCEMSDVTATNRAQECGCYVSLPFFQLSQM